MTKLRPLSLLLALLGMTAFVITGCPETDDDDSATPTDDDDAVDDDDSGDDDDSAGPGPFGFTDFGSPPAVDQVDRAGKPAVATALILDPARKGVYNDSFPADDLADTFVPDIVAALTAFHSGLDDDLIGLGLTPCAQETKAGLDVIPCVTQEVATGVIVKDLVIPDTLVIDASADPGFPNGRRLADPVIDITLAVVLLDLTAHEATTFIDLNGNGTPLEDLDGDGIPGGTGETLNPGGNDVPFQATFPYLAAPNPAAR